MIAGLSVAALSISACSKKNSTPVPAPVENTVVADDNTTSVDHATPGHQIP